MAWRKPDPVWVEKFLAALPEDERVARRQMFGYPASFVGGNFFAGMHETRIVVRMPGDSKSRLAALAKAEPFDPRGTGKGMKDWWVVPPATASSPSALKRLLADAFAEVRTLPAKPPKAQKSRKTTPLKRKRLPV